MMYKCRRHGISKHIHLEEDGNVLPGIFDFFLGTRILTKDKRDVDSSDALSDQVSSLDIDIVGE